MLVGKLLVEGMGRGGVSFDHDKKDPIDVVSIPRQCCYDVLGMLDSFTIKGGSESCITELAKG